MMRHSKRLVHRESEAVVAPGSPRTASCSLACSRLPAATCGRSFVAGLAMSRLRTPLPGCGRIGPTATRKFARRRPSGFQKWRCPTSVD